MLVLALVVVGVGLPCWMWCVTSGNRVPRGVLLVAGGFFGMGFGAWLLVLTREPFHWLHIVFFAGTAFGFVDVMRRARAWGFARHGASVAARLEHRRDW